MLTSRMKKKEDIEVELFFRKVHFNWLKPGKGLRLNCVCFSATCFGVKGSWG